MADDVERWVALGIYDPTSPEADERLELLQFAAEHGIGDDELVERVAAGTLGRAVVDSVLAVERRYDIEEAARRSGLDPELLRRSWMALGFPLPPPGQPTFNDDDIELLSAFRLVEGLFGLTAALQFTRVMGSSVARLGEAAVASFMVNVEAPMVAEGVGLAEWARTAAESAEIAKRLPALLDPIFRRHFELAVARGRMTQDPERGTFNVTVGFCDIVGYTRWSQQLTPMELGAAVNDFEELAHDLITAAGSRLIKSVGDAVLFSTIEPGAAAQVALDLTDAVDAHGVLPPIRSGLATGAVIGRDGDLYGPVVNLAARIVKETAPGTVVSDRPIEGYDSRSIGVVELRGVAEPTELFVIDRR